MCDNEELLYKDLSILAFKDNAVRLMVCRESESDCSRSSYFILSLGGMNSIFSKCYNLGFELFIYPKIGYIKNIYKNLKMLDSINVE